MITILYFIEGLVIGKLLVMLWIYISSKLPEPKVKLTRQEYNELKGAVSFAEGYNDYYDLCLKDVLKKKKITKADIKKIKKGEYLCFDFKEIHLSKDGNKMYVNDKGNRIQSYVLNKAWDISTSYYFTTFKRKLNEKETKTN